ncbi:MAG: HupE/UreJ family protein [Acidobacteriota bacterium]
MSRPHQSAARAAGAIRPDRNVPRGGGIQRLAAAGLLALGVVGLPAPATAHTLGMTSATLRFSDDGRFQLDLIYDVTAILAGVQPGHLMDRDVDAILRLPVAEKSRRLAAIRDAMARGVDLRFDGRPVPLPVLFPKMETALGKPRPGIALPGKLVRLAGRVPPGAHAFTLEFDRFIAPVVLNVHPPGGGPVDRVALAPGSRSAPFSLDAAGWNRSGWAVAWQYLFLGYTHILPRGLDHILFVLGLFLLTTRLRPLLVQVTSFTVAHSVTLGLSMYGLVSLPTRVVEPLIAISIAYVALENVATAELKPWRPAVVFGFGLLHGLGFASVLRDLGLPRSEFLTALVAFNGGVEFGQLSVIGGAFLLAGWFRSRVWYRSRMVIPASLAIAVIGLYWAVQRTFLI